MYPSMHWAGGCVSQHALGRGVSTGGFLPRGVSVQVGVCLYRGNVCPGGVAESACWDTHSPTSVNRITDACENIALPQLRCGR